MQIPETRRSLQLGIWLILVITALRLAGLAANRTELFVDEAQYWFWGQSIEFGYYSKPPLIGWLIGLVTDMAGSDAAFWVRAPAPVLHGATAIILMLIARRTEPAPAAMLVGLAYLTIPGVVFGSLLMSTDTVMLPFYAVAMAAYLSLIRAGSARMAVLMGASLGLAFMAKYAAIYFIMTLGLAAAFLPTARIAWRHILTAAFVFLVVISPNLIWNLQNGLTTISHTLDNVEWVRGDTPGFALNVDKAGEFLASQFIFFGPLLFAGYLWALFAAREHRLFLWLSLPIILLVTAQALGREANANWAAPAYLAAALMTVPFLWARAKWLLIAALALNLVIAVALPVMTLFPETARLSASGPLILERYVGRRAVSEELFATARRNGLDIVVSDHRDILADLFYRRGPGDAQVYARPVAGRAPHHYALNNAMPSGITGQVLFASPDAPAQVCGADELGAITQAQGAYRGMRIGIYRVSAACLRPGSG